MLLLNHPELWQFIFFQEIFDKNSQTIRLYCFTRYQKYLCKIFPLWTYPFLYTNHRTCIHLIHLICLIWNVTRNGLAVSRILWFNITQQRVASVRGMCFDLLVYLTSLSIIVNYCSVVYWYFGTYRLVEHRCCW